MTRPTYPIQYIPHDYNKYYTGNPYPDVFDLEPPKKPVMKFKKESESKGCLEFFMPFAGFILIIGIIASFSEGFSGQSILAIGGAGLVVYLWFRSEDNEDNKQKEVNKENEVNNIRYSEQSRAYYKKLKEFENLQEIRKDPSKNRLYRQEKLKEILKNTRKANITYIGPKGKHDLSFARLLSIYFPKKIFINLIIEHFTKEPYQPDIIFHDEESNLWIDIEIDEPYDSNTKTPIHYINESGNPVDLHRDQYFLSKGWFIIRFSENQVVSNPFGCCLYLQSFLKKHISYQSVRQIPSTDEIKPELCWTYDEALTLARSNFRKNQ